MSFKRNERPGLDREPPQWHATYRRIEGTIIGGFFGLMAAGTVPGLIYANSQLTKVADGALLIALVVLAVRGLRMGVVQTGQTVTVRTLQRTYTTQRGEVARFEAEEYPARSRRRARSYLVIELKDRGRRTFKSFSGPVSQTASPSVANVAHDLNVAWGLSDRAQTHA
jgi:hypothetical protein